MLEKLFLEMISYYSGDPKRIQHFTKVHSYAKLIGEREQLSPEELYILEAAAYCPPRWRPQYPNRPCQQSIMGIAVKPTTRPPTLAGRDNLSV